MHAHQTPQKVLIHVDSDHRSWNSLRHVLCPLLHNTAMFARLIISCHRGQQPGPAATPTSVSSTASILICSVTPQQGLLSPPAPSLTSSPPIPPLQAPQLASPRNPSMRHICIRSFSLSFLSHAACLFLALIRPNSSSVRFLHCCVECSMGLLLTCWPA